VSLGALASRVPNCTEIFAITVLNACLGAATNNKCIVACFKHVPSRVSPTINVHHSAVPTDIAAQKIFAMEERPLEIVAKSMKSVRVKCAQKTCHLALV
jgi:hypothetical protein